MAETKDGEAAIDSSAAPAAMEPLNDESTSCCYLLELPPELRNEIWKLVLRQPEGVKVNLKTGCIERKDIALTMTNKQLQKECGPLYFSLNTFVFNLTYIGDTEPDPTYEWFDEQATFNYFIRKHRASLQDVRIHFQGLNDVRQVICTAGMYFLENIRALRTGFAIMQANNVYARLSLCLDLNPLFTLDLPLNDKAACEVEIRTQIRTAYSDMSDLPGSEYERWLRKFRQILPELLYGEYRRIHF